MGIGKNISLYIHVPFCKKKCRYCDFYSVRGNDALVDKYIGALVREWELTEKKYLLEDATVSTLFFGGGTPSLLSVSQWNTISERLISRLNLSQDYEWSIECNPESFSVEKAFAWKNFGVNRLSLGIQSFVDRELNFIGRIHDAPTALSVLNEPVFSQFSSLGVDLMYGLPGQTLGSLEQSLRSVFEHPHVNHLSAYELTIASKTPLGRHQGILPLPTEDTVVAMSDTLVTKAKMHGFDRYEISNFAKPGYSCKHNEAYWHHRPYIGLGPSAHSYMPPERFSNVADIERYCSMLENGEFPRDVFETIDNETLSREIIFLGLRTSQGLNEDYFHECTGKTFLTEFRKPLLQHYVKQKSMTYRKPFWALTQKGMLFADGIARELL